MVKYLCRLFGQQLALRWSLTWERVGRYNNCVLPETNNTALWYVESACTRVSARCRQAERNNDGGVASPEPSGSSTPLRWRAYQYPRDYVIRMGKEKKKKLAKNDDRRGRWNPIKRLRLSTNAAATCWAKRTEREEEPYSPGRPYRAITGWIVSGCYCTLLNKHFAGLHLFKKAKHATWFPSRSFHSWRASVVCIDVYHWKRVPPWLGACGNVRGPASALNLPPGFIDWGRLSLLAKFRRFVFQSSFWSSHYDRSITETKEKEREREREKSLLLCDTRHFLYSPCLRNLGLCIPRDTCTEIFPATYWLTHSPRFTRWSVFPPISAVEGILFSRHPRQIPVPHSRDTFHLLWHYFQSDVVAKTIGSACRARCKTR